MDLRHDYRQRRLAVQLLNQAGFEHIQTTTAGLFITSAQDARQPLPKVIVNGGLGSVGNCP